MAFRLVSVKHFMRWLFFLFFAIPFTYASSHSHAHFTNASDQHSLLQFKASIWHDPQNALTNWNPNGTPFCNWTGVECNSHRQRVVALRLTSMGLQGSLSPFLGNLSFLDELLLGNNSFYGVIPHELGFLRRLKVLALSYNPLSGSIPWQLGLLSNLQILYLGVNHLAGTIPSSLANISSLIELQLGANNLSGAIPSEFGRLGRLRRLLIEESRVSGGIPSSLSNISTLTELVVESNQIDGVIPPQLGLLTNLNHLSLYQNFLRGPIPSSLSNCTSLQILDLGDNDLTGRIPSELGHKLATLQELYLGTNQLSGSIPDALANVSQLTILELLFNQLSGVIPIEFGKLTLLERLSLGHNQLVSGNSTLLPVLTNLANCSLLQELVLGNNRLSGALPPAIGQLSANLSILDLSNNMIGGRIPQQIGNLTNLSLLALFGNLFNGSIPPEFRRLQSLERLYLGNNTLQGSIPSEIGQLRGLGLLALQKNMLSGSIPDSLGALEQLRELHLYENHLSGKIPATLAKCWRLEVLDLSFNRFTGNIPPEVAGLPNLAIYFNLSSNYLQGSLPPQVGKMVMVQAIDISANRLAGIIPSTIGGCAGLQYLNLSHNAFRGTIPLSIGSSKSLQDIDFSYNKLSGKIPKSLEKLYMLSHLNFSYNNLAGEIPRGGNFANFSIESFKGNPSLCGPWLLHSPVCPNPTLSKRTERSLLKKVVPPIASICAFILCCLLVGYVWGVKKARLSKFFVPKREFPVISYPELVLATDGFSEGNLIGVGSFGSVYKGILGDGTLIAVKVFNLQDEEQDGSFEKECKALRTARHRNLVRIVTSCSNLRFKALVLQFMSNGSLEKNLYHDDGNACSLSLASRLSICIDIAHGMEYLHHDCYVQIVHCDLKPNNVLLDDDLTAHIADFGLARLISEDSFTSTLALGGTIGYIAPEYGVGGRLSTKGDVYSYGVLLLEMLTRKRPSSDMFVGGLDLRKWVRMAFPDRLAEVVDGGLLRDVSDGGIEGHDIYRCLTQLIHLGLLCTKQSPEERPTMREVVGVLEIIRGTFTGTEASKFPADIASLLGSTNIMGNNDGAFDSQCSSTL